jgi:putative endonuclease
MEHCIFGVTSNLIKRVWQHKNKVIKGFTSKYHVDKLVYFEEFQEIILAIHREKRLKEWKRDWKMNLIERSNPQWIDLYSESFQQRRTSRGMTNF